jgi:pimeloyl-ACP methyl ester carboxylesterase
MAGEPSSLRLWLSYGDAPVKVTVNGEEVTVEPGVEAKVELGEEAVVKAGARTFRLEAPPTESQVASLAQLKESEDPLVRGLAEQALTIAGRRSEVDSHFAEILKTALALASGETKPSEVREVHWAKEGPTIFRAKFPEKWSEPKTVVIGLHGAGGSENLFFEGYGSGAVPAEALKRGWAFFAPKSAPRATSDCVEWLKKTYGFAPDRVFVVGHSMGGGIALGTHTLEPKPAALGLFAPAAANVPGPFRETPIFLAVGAQEIPMLKDNAMRLADRVSDDSVVKIYPDCEHLMIVADAARDCFQFFDGLGNSRAGR